jgi:hypothetical protein
LAGKPIDQPGIFEGLDSEPPIIFKASFVCIISFSYKFLYHCNIVLSSLPPEACSLQLPSYIRWPQANANGVYTPLG